MTNELNPMDLKTSSAYLEYILQSEGELLWMHFDEAQRIESAGKDEAFDEGFEAGFKAARQLTGNLHSFLAMFRRVGGD